MTVNHDLPLNTPDGYANLSPMQQQVNLDIEPRQWTQRKYNNKMADFNLNDQPKAVTQRRNFKKKKPNVDAKSSIYRKTSGSPNKLNTEIDLMQIYHTERFDK